MASSEDRYYRNNHGARTFIVYFILAHKLSSEINLQSKILHATSFKDKPHMVSILFFCIYIKQPNTSQKITRLHMTLAVGGTLKPNQQPTQ